MNTLHDVTPISSQVEGDRAVRKMIEELIESMYIPVKIAECTNSKDASTQAGYSCPLCNVFYSSKSGLFRHKKGAHERKPYLCGMCNAGYCRLPSLTRHLNRVHGNMPVNKK